MKAPKLALLLSKDSDDGGPEEETTEGEAGSDSEGDIRVGEALQEALDGGDPAAIGAAIRMAVKACM